MPLVADWATDEDIAKGIGVFYAEVCSLATAPELYVLRSYAQDLAKAISDDAEAARDEANALLAVLDDKSVTDAAACPMVAGTWILANRYRGMNCCANLHVAGEALEEYSRVVYATHATPPPKPFPWGHLALGVVVTLGVGYGVGKIITHSTRGH